MRSKRACRFTAASAIFAVAVSGPLVLAGMAHADPPAGSIGSLTFTPASGTNDRPVNAKTSTGCTQGGNAVNMTVVGPIGAADPNFPASNPFPITTTENNEFSATAPFNVPAGVSLQAAAAHVNATKALQPGEYDFTVHCVDQDLLTESGTFTGALILDSATNFHASGSTPGASPTPTAAPTPTASPTPSASPNPDATPTPDTTPTSSPTPDSATNNPTGAVDNTDTGVPSEPQAGTQSSPSTSTLANTGTPLGPIFIGGLILLVAGLTLLGWLRLLRRPRGRGSHSR